jgi:hypothetical protein
MGKGATARCLLNGQPFETQCFCEGSLAAHLAESSSNRSSYRHRTAELTDQDLIPLRRPTSHDDHMLMHSGYSTMDAATADAIPSLPASTLVGDEMGTCRGQSEVLHQREELDGAQSLIYLVMVILQPCSRKLASAPKP